MHKTTQFLDVQCVSLKLFSWTCFQSFMGRNSWVYNMQVRNAHTTHYSWYTYKWNPKIFCITMQNGGSGGTFVRYRYHKFYRSRASCFRQFTMLSTIFSAIYISTIFPAICIYINCTTFEIANLFFKTKKTTSHPMYKGYS